MGWFRKETYCPPGIPLQGSFDSGWALDVHGISRDGEWHRTTVGEKIYRLKYRGRRACGLWLARVCLKFLRRLDPPWEIDAIIAVPPSRPRRRLSPAETVSAKIARALGVPFLQGALYKTRPTRFVKEGLTFEQKQQIIRGTIALSKADMIEGKRILLMDDLFKSGATCEEAVLVLRSAFPAWIGFLTFTLAGGDQYQKKND